VTATCPSIGHIGATWRIRLNLCILQPTRVHNQYGKWICSAVFASLRQKVPILYNGRPYPPELPLPMGDLDLPCNTWSFRFIRVQPKQHLDRFSRLCTDDREVSLYFTMVCLFSLKIAPSHVGIWTSFNTWFIGPTRIQNANGNVIVSAVFAGLRDWQSDRKTDRPRYSVQCAVIMHNYVWYGKAAIVWL